MAVKAGAGAAVSSRLAVETSLRSGQLKAVPFELAERAFMALRNRERHFSEAAYAPFTNQGAIRDRGERGEVRS
jgi:hypothetical protein